jgi:Ala-tRNA(Pro) deacylase
VDYTAEEVAADTHTALYDFAKVVIVRAGGEYAMAVLPAHHRVDLGALREALGDQPVELASEDEIARIIPDCDVGAVAPFGRLYALPVVLSLALSHRDRVTFNAGTHTAAIRMKYPDFERIAGGRVLDFSISPLEEDS